MKGLMDRNDRQWVLAAVERYEGALTAYAAHIVGDVDRARDVVQDTFIKLCSQDREEIEPHLAEWLYTVCRNRALDVRRKERRMTLMAEGQAEAVRSARPGPEQVVEDEDSAAGVLRAIEQLPENQREVIRLKFQHGMSYKQISEITKLSVTNVGFLISTGLKTVRERMAKSAQRRSL